MAKVPDDGKVRYATGEEVVVGDKVQTEHEGAGFVTRVVYPTDPDHGKLCSGTGALIVCDSIDRDTPFVIEYGSTAWQHLIFLFREDMKVKPHFGRGMSFVCRLPIQDDTQWNLTTEQLVGQVEAGLAEFGATSIRRTLPEWKVGGRRSFGLKWDQESWNWAMSFTPATSPELVAIITSPGNAKRSWRDLNNHSRILIRINEWLEGWLDSAPEVLVQETLTADHWVQRLIGLL